VVTLTESERFLPSQAAQRKRKALNALGDLPPFPAILTRLLASLAGENVSFLKIGDLIEKDTVIAGNLLYLVNSALYARRETVNSVRHALSLLGMDRVRNAILGMSITRIWRSMAMPSQWSMARFDLHSSAVAILADLLAQRLPVAYPEGAFIAGLLHDIGRLMIARALPDEMEAIETQHYSEGRSRIECEMEVLGFTHAELSAEALEQWRLPEPVLAAVLHHHSPERESSSEIPLSRVLAAANERVNSSGTSIGAQPDSDCADPALIESLGLDDLAGLLAEFEAEYAAMSAFFR
jgi:putative nucleotidyltransferase with HDIG domain